MYDIKGGVEREKEREGEREKERERDHHIFDGCIFAILSQSSVRSEISMLQWNLR